MPIKRFARKKFVFYFDPAKKKILNWENAFSCL